MKRLTDRRPHELLTLFLLVAAVSLVYSNTLDAPFVFDDVINIRNNPHIRLTHISTDGIHSAGFRSLMARRPVANISFALNYYVHRYRVAGYHLVNISIHIATGILLYYLVKTTLALAAVRPGRSIAFFTTLIWMMHPVQTQTVTYIVQRMNGLATMFYLASLLMYIKGRLAEKAMKRILLFGGCLLAGILALGSKEIAVTLPFFILLYEWYFFRQLSREWLKRYAPVFAGLPCFGVMLLYIYLGPDPFTSLFAYYEVRDFNMFQRVLTEFRVVVFYMSLLLFPHPSRLNLAHDFPISFSFTEPATTLPAMAVVMGLVVLAACIAKSKPLISFCMLWYFGNLAVESSVIPLELVFEHRNYLPSTLACLLLVLSVYRWAGSEALRLSIVGALVLICALWSYERNGYWRDKVVFWQDSLKKSPQLARAHLNLGVALEGRGRVDEAMHHYRESLRLKPDDEIALANIALVLADRGNTSEAVTHLNRALEVKPSYAKAHNQLGIILAGQGKGDEAMGHLTEARRLDPLDPEPPYNMGNVLMTNGRVAEAIRLYGEALALDPFDAMIHNNLGIALFREGRLDRAIFHFRQALEENSDAADIRDNLLKALARRKGLADGAGTKGITGSE